MIYRIAVGTLDGIEITEHFGRCETAALWDINQDTNAVTPLGTRHLGEADESVMRGCGYGCNDDAVSRKIDALSDCQIVLMARIGGHAERQLIHRNIVPLQFDGLVRDALDKVKEFYRKRVFQT